MKKVRTLILIVAMTLIGRAFWVMPSVAQGQPSPEVLVAAAQSLVWLQSPAINAEVSAQTFNQFWLPLEATLREKFPNISQEAIGAVRTEFQNLQKIYVAESLKDIPAIYARYFTPAEIQQLNSFFQTPVGAKYMQVMPAIMAELITAPNTRLQAMRAQISGPINGILRKYGYAPD